MRISYIGHSGFFIEGERHCLLFDYESGQLPDIPEDKRLLVFVSHHHADHYNPEIFRFGERYAETLYLLGRDISLSPGLRKRNGISDEMLKRCIRMHTDEQLCLADCDILALRSTDEGAAFLLGCEGKTLFHAGDLNLWGWGEDTEGDRRMREAYMREIDKLADREIDAAFLPLDPRLEEHCADGLLLFAERIQPKMIFPMHCWENYTVIDRLKHSAEAGAFRDRIAEIHARGDSFEL